MQLALSFTCSALLLALGLSGAAQAARIEPADTAFTASGPISFTKGLLSSDCTITLSGRVAADGSQASVSSVAFSGESFKCARVTATHLPWTITPTGESTGAMSGIQVNIRAPLLGGECGPSTATGTWDNAQSRLLAQDAKLDGGCVIDQVAIDFKPAFRLLP